MLIKSLAVYLFEKMPNWVKIPLVFVLVPVVSIFSLLWFTHFLPWHTESVRSEIMSYEQRRDLQIGYILKQQETQNTIIKEDLERIRNSQNIILNHLLRGEK